MIESSEGEGGREGECCSIEGGVENNPIFNKLSYFTVPNELRMPGNDAVSLSAINYDSIARSRNE